MKAKGQIFLLTHTSAISEEKWQRHSEFRELEDKVLFNHVVQKQK